MRATPELRIRSPERTTWERRGPVSPRGLVVLEACISSFSRGNLARGKRLPRTKNHPRPTSEDQDSMPVGPMQFGAINDAGPDETTLRADNLGTTLLVENPTADVVTALGGNVGVRASADPDSEVGIGVDGDGAIGVFGTGVTRGVLGDSFSNRRGRGNGVEGRSNVQGRNGVFGHHFGLGVGVRARCNSGFGVFGESVSSVGVGGDSGSSNGVQGRTTGTGFAGAFFGRTGIVGNLAVFGNFTVVPPGVKSMAMPHPDGSYRRLYTLESTESWFEDFGKGEIIEGKCHVDLDPDYAAIVRLDEYHVFLAPEGDSMGLYVASKDSTGFEVREQQGGTSTLTFSYRVVARRQDIEAKRLERVEAEDVSPPIPAETTPPTTELPEVPSRSTQSRVEP